MYMLKPTASPYEVERFMSECRASALEAYLDDRDPREDPGHAVEFMDEED